MIPSLHPWDEPHLVMVYALFSVLLDAVCQYFVEDFSISIHQQYRPEVFLSVMSLSGLGCRMMLALLKGSGSLPSS